MLPVLPQPGLLRGPRETQRCDPNSSWPPLLVWVDDTGAPVTKIELLPSYSTVALIDEPAEVADPWDLPELRDTGIKWSGKRQGGLPSVRGWVLGLHSVVLFLAVAPRPCTQRSWLGIPPGSLGGFESKHSVRTGGSFVLSFERMCQHWGTNQAKRCAAP